MQNLRPQGLFEAISLIKNYISRKLALPAEVAVYQPIGWRIDAGHPWVMGANLVRQPSKCHLKIWILFSFQIFLQSWLMEAPTGPQWRAKILAKAFPDRRPKGQLMKNPSEIENSTNFDEIWSLFFMIFRQFSTKVSSFKDLAVSQEKPCFDR